jgi:hypothetical protein
VRAGKRGQIDNNKQAVENESLFLKEKFPPPRNNIPKLKLKKNKLIN